MLELWECFNPYGGIKMDKKKISKKVVIISILVILLLVILSLVIYVTVKKWTEIKL